MRRHLFAQPRAARIVGALLLLTVLAALLVPSVLAATPASAQQTEFGQRFSDSVDPVSAAVRLSQELVLEGDATRVVLGRSDVFADDLAGAAATGGGGPLLLVDPAPASLRQEVLDEVQRVLPIRDQPRDCAVEGDDVLVLGGVAAVGDAVIDQLLAAGRCPVRLAGPDRIGTAAEVASYRLAEYLTPESSRGTLLIATAGNPADSAAASAWAALNGHIVVVTGRDTLDQRIADLIQPGDTAWDRIILLGGEAALSAAVEDQVRQVAADFPTEIIRIAGATRDDTAFRVANELFDAEQVAAATIVEGYAEDFWAYALPAAALSGRYGQPMLYVQTDSVPSTTDVYLRQTPLQFLWTIGPDVRISETTRAAAEASLGSGVQPDPVE